MVSQVIIIGKVRCIDAAQKLRRWVAGAILIGLAANAHAGPGFIESSRVSGDSMS